MIRRISARSWSLLILCCVAQMVLPSSDAGAQERMELTATAEQGAVATYSEPLDVRGHSLFGRPGALDLATLRIAGTVRNSGSTPVRITVFVVADEAYRERVSRHPDGYYLERGSLHPDGYYLERGSRHPDGYYGGMDPRTGQRAPGGSADGSVALFQVEVGARAAVDLASHAPQDPVALERMMADGPVRFGIAAESVTRNRPVGVVIGANSGIPTRPSRSRPHGASRPPSEAARPLQPFVTTRDGDVPLLPAGARPAAPFFRGGPVFPAHRGAPGGPGTAGAEHERSRTAHRPLE